MSKTMLAAVLHGAKDLRLEPYAQPELPAGMVLLRVRRTGICGSDLHYFEHGDCGPFVPTQPFILGHELTAEVAALADDVTVPAVGTRVTVNPARACGFCEYCARGRRNLCRRTVMLGSASTKPPTNGAFAEFVAVRADQCYSLPPQMDDGLGAMIEPLAVALHAANRAGPLSGKRVLVTGGGPIGLLVAVTSRAFGATPVALSDPVAARRKAALDLGVEVALDPGAKSVPDQIRALTGDGFDVILEASGARPALRAAFDWIRPGGTIIQIGTPGTEDVPLPANELMVREIQFVGSFRYGEVFDQAIRLVASGRVNLQPLITGLFPLREADEAMAQAADKAHALKIQLEIS